MLLQLLAVLATPQSLHTLVGNIGGLGKLFKKQVFYINFKLAFRCSDTYMKIPSTTETSLLLEILLAHDNYENKITQHSWCLCYKQFWATYPAEETTRATLNGEPTFKILFWFLSKIFFIFICTKWVYILKPCFERNKNVLAGKNLKN